MPETMHERYERATSLHLSKLNGMMRNRTIQPRWAADSSSLWWTRQTEDAVEHVRLHLPSLERELIEEPTAASPRPATVPFRRDHDLWIRRDGQETRLTHDGEEYFAWGALTENNNMNIPLKRVGLELPPVFTHVSPSGRYVLSARVDERAAEPLVFLEQVPADRARPRQHLIRTVLGDERGPSQTQVVIIDTESLVGRPVALAMEQLGALLLNGASVLTWGIDEREVYLFAHATGAPTAALLAIDTATGAHRAVIEEIDTPLYEPNTFLYGLPLIRVLPASGDVVWFSQRDGRGHLFRYDLATGECRNAITAGELVVRDIVHVDPESRTLLVVAGSEAPGDNPYLRRCYRVSLEGGAPQLLTPEALDHDIPGAQPAFFALVFGQGKEPAAAVSPDGRWLVDHVSAVDTPPRILLRDVHAGGRVVATLETTDVTMLLTAGYQPPRSFSVPVDDTTVWRVILIPDEATAEQPVPLVDHMYAGFQVNWQPSAWLGGCDALLGREAGLMCERAALGLATVIIDGRGTPGRNKRFRQWTQGRADTARGLEDHATVIRELGRRHPELDLSRVGVRGHSYGGYNSARAMLLLPDTFHVGVSSAAVHDPAKSPRGAWAWHVGLATEHTDPAFIALSNLPLADRLEGRLLVAFGDLDENAPPDHSLAFVKALVAAGKRFDLKVWPGANHYQSSPYTVMVEWDHFVQYLLLETPPDFTPDLTAHWDATGTSTSV